VRAQPVDQFDHTGESRAAPKCPLACALDRGPVRNGIAKRYAEFDDIGTRLGRRENDFLARRKGGIARREIGDKAQLAGIRQSTKPT
jgi:hypothetical protein